MRSLSVSLPFSVLPFRFPARSRLSRGVTASGLSVVLLFVGVAPAQPATILSDPPPATSTQVTQLGDLGNRPGATRLPVSLSDQAAASIDVGTGNVLASFTLGELAVVGGRLPITAVTNSLLSGDTGAGVVDGWRVSIGGAGSISSSGSDVLWTDGSGYSARFTPSTAEPGKYVAPAGTKASLAETTDGYRLTALVSRMVVLFDPDGTARSITDRNGNKTVIEYSGDRPSKVVSTAGPADARTAWIEVRDDSITVFQGADKSKPVRYASLTKTSNGWTSYRDMTGAVTALGWSGARLSSVTVPDAGEVRFGYDTSGRAVSITQVNATAGSPGDSVTRLAYPSASSTLLADPMTDPAEPVGSVPRTTYTLNTSGRVTGVTDPAGRAQSATYTANFDVQSATSGTGTTAGTMTNTYGANDGLSLTASKAPGGATGQFGYANTEDASKFLPSSATDSFGNTRSYTYSAAGNPLTATDALAAVAAVTYNPDGTVATATAPGNGTNRTLYTYNTNAQLTRVTPVTGSSLAAETYTYDNLGRLATRTTGRGVTVSYAYDAAGRLTGVSFNDATPSVTFAYNGRGVPVSRTDQTGTTAWGYDQMGRLISRTHPAAGGTIRYEYDKASRLSATVDGRGRTAYQYDNSGTLTAIKYLQSGAAKTTYVAHDDRGRRTDLWFNANGDKSLWSAWKHTEYDIAGRVRRVTVRQGTGNASNTVVLDRAYCYAAGTTPPTCPTATSTADRSKIGWIYNHTDGTYNTHTYDKAGRLLTSQNVNGAGTLYQYTYDARGNRTSYSLADGTSGTVTFNPANQVTNTGYAYDADGNLTKDPNGAYTWNSKNQMMTATPSGTAYTYTYAGLSQTELIDQTTPQGRYQYVYGRTDRNGLPMIEQVIKDGATAYIEHDPVTGEPLMLRTSEGLYSVYTTDGAFNQVRLITGAGTTATVKTFDPYGATVIEGDNTTTESTQNPYTYKWALRDRTTGWHHFGARRYNPIIGVWTQMDTLDAPLDPHNANRYAYAGCDPINNYDPTGLLAVDDCVQQKIVGSSLLGAGVGVAVGGVLGAVAGAPVGGVGAIFGAAGGAVAGATIGGTRGALNGTLTGNIICRLPLPQSLQWLQ